MRIAIAEYSSKTYPDNPAILSDHHNHNRYSYQQVILKKIKGSHFTFILVPANKKSATIRIENIDVSLMTPSIPSWIKNDPNLIRIALTDRQWNRQQVSFAPSGAHINIKGGDGFQKQHTIDVELAKNCLNAGLWEILLYNKEGGRKKLYYQGWFTFPLGYYKQLFENNTYLSYLKHWYYLEHWFDPQNTVVPLNKLRHVISSQKLNLKFDPKESVIARGEQINKKKGIITKNPINTFQDYYKNSVKFSTFVPPGIYRKDKPWSNKYYLIEKPVQATLNSIVSPAYPNKILQEIVITYLDKKGKKISFYLSGIDLNTLPKLDINHYNQGNLYLMGIGTAPLEETYSHLVQHPPNKSAIFSVLLTQTNEWINHHDVAIDGAIVFLDKYNSNQLHLYLVSYERQAVISHYTLGAIQLHN